MRIADFDPIPEGSIPDSRHSRLKLFFQMALNRILKDRLALFFHRSFKCALSSVPSSLIQRLILRPIHGFNFDVVIQHRVVAGHITKEE